MREWLYGKDGYYSRFKKIGKEGDFYTSVSTTPFFGGAIAKRILAVIESGFLSKNCTVLEVGAHQGYLLADIVQFIFTLRPNLLKTLRFAIIEPQEEILKEQKWYLQSSFGDAVGFDFYRSFDEIKIEEAFIVANEIFDAFACEVIKDESMLFVENFDFDFCKQTKEVENLSKRYGIKRGEIAIGYEEFAKNMADKIEKFEFVTFDYGELEHRGEYSLRVYDTHKVYPFFSLTKFAEDEKLKKRGINIGKLYKKSDITYDVFFTHLIDAFNETGVKNESYKTQMSALVEFGIIELLEILKRAKGEKAYLSELNRVKVLIDPTFMGERFKCAVFRKES